MNRYFFTAVSIVVSLLLIGPDLAVGAKSPSRKREKMRAPAPEGVGRQLTIRGVVFEDLNRDGHRDADEPALSGMSVSNGIDWVRTSEDGAYEFILDEHQTGTAFVCTPAGWRASKQYFVIADFDEYTDEVQPGDIGLQRDPSREGNSFTFVQLSDTHVTDAVDTIETMIDDLNVVNRLTETPVFVATTGDLINLGERVPEFKGYLRAVKTCAFPYYNIIGNHDYGGDARKSENYEKFIGPRYYSFTVGNCHFIAKDIIASLWDQQALERQNAWIEEDIRRNAGSRQIIVLQHFIPTNEELDWWSRFKTKAIFSGHWHGRRERLYKGILDVNSAPLRFGSIDRSPRGFRVVHVDGDQITCEWRVAQQDKRVEVIQPAGGATVSCDRVHLQVLAYDTAVRVNKVRYRIETVNEAGGEAETIHEGEMNSVGRWMWTADCGLFEDKVKSASVRMVAEAFAADGSTWQAESTFQVSKVPAAVPQMGEDWRFFHGDAGHRGYLTTGPRPPLTMAWAAHLGGTVLLASPVIADGKVYAGTGFGESLNDCAVHALDLRTGKPLWREPVDSSIQHSLAVWEDNVLAVSEAANLYCFDTSGKPRWTSSLFSEASLRWELSFPVTDGHTIYAGRGVGFGAYSLETGEPIWHPVAEGTRPLGDWWPSIYSGPSIGTDRIYQGGSFVRALSPSDGKVLWTRADTAVSTVAVVPAVVEQGVDGDRLYVFHNDKTLLCLDGEDGKTIWKANRGDPVAATQPAIEVPMGYETGTPAVGEKVVCLGSGEVRFPGEDKPSAAMHGFDKATGKLLWRYPVGTGLVSSIQYRRNEATITSSPVIVGDVVYFGANDGYLYALNVDDGSLLWRYRLGVPIASTVAVTGNTVIVVGWDGTVYAFTSNATGSPS